MANQQNLDLIKQRVEEWNQRRKEIPNLKLNFRRTDLTNVMLDGTNLSGANLSNALQPHFLEAMLR